MGTGRHTYRKRHRLMIIEVHADAAAAASASATAIAIYLTDAVNKRGEATFAVSGGSTPAAMLSMLSTMDLPWNDIVILQVDERIAPDGDPERNINMLHRELIEPLAARDFHPTVAPMAVQNAIEVNAEDYGELIESLAPIDVVQLGLGSDGHTASLVPDDCILKFIRPSDPLVAITAPYQGTRRMSLTVPALRAASHRVWLATGSGKATAVKQLVRADQTIPATLVACPSDRVVVDEAAAAAVD